MDTPEYRESKIPAPKVTREKIETPKQTDTVVPTPQVTENNLQAPKVGHPQNCITIGQETIEIKPTKLKYQRDGTASFYRILQTMPVVDILSLDPAMLDMNRTPDKMLFDWLIAVTDNARFVTRYYDRFDSDIIEQLLKIFCRLNHIDEREERKIGWPR